MTRSNAEGFIRLFGLYMFARAFIDLMRSVVGLAIFDSGMSEFQGPLAGGLGWALVQIALTAVIGIVVLNVSGFLAEVVVPDEE